ncbi:MAG: LTA synthase family protein, partial [Bdellovibrionota bacterium]|nr:LTA synthase family protein [Bdellovibrionota bacterium]
YICAPILLLSFLVLLFRSLKLWSIFYKITRFYLCTFLVLITALFVWDITFYHYFTDHFNLLVFGLWEDDTKALLESLWKNEPLFLEFLGFSFMTWLIYKYLGLAEKKFFFNFSIRNFLARVISYLAAFLIVGLGARGSLNFDMHPLNRIHTEISPHLFVNQIAFSPIFALSDAIKLGFKIRKHDYNIIKEMGYEGNIQQAFKDLYSKGESELVDLKQNLHFVTPKHDGPSPHVVVFAMESMGAFWMQMDSENFPIQGNMRKHFQEDVLNLNFMPSGNGTYASVTHWLTNLPALPGVAPAERFVGKNYITSSIRPFKEAGYETHYMYGGGLGWRNLSPFLKDLGFDELHGETRIEESLGGKLEKHPWGVFDEDLMKYVEKHLRNSDKPQLLFVLSTTNHPPFDVPKDYPRIKFNYPEKLKSRLQKISDTLDQRLLAYRYAMDSLGTFMDKLKAKKLSRPLLVAASGDHSFYESVAFRAEDLIEWRGVPLYMYSSLGNLPKKDLQSKFASHANIFPSLYDLALDEVEYVSVAKSLLRAGHSFALSSFGYVDDKVSLVGDLAYIKTEDGQYHMQKEDNSEVSTAKKLRRAFFAISEFLIRESPNVEKASIVPER